MFNLGHHDIQSVAKVWPHYIHLRNPKRNLATSKATKQRPLPRALTEIPTLQKITGHGSN